MAPPPGTTKTDQIVEKFVPIAVYLIITLPIWGGFLLPDFTAYFIILYNVYFFYRATTTGIYFIISFLKIRASEQIDWQKKLESTINPDATVKHLEKDLARIKKQKWSKQFKIDLKHSAELKEKIDKDDIRSLHLIDKLPSFLHRLAFLLEKRKQIKFLKSEIKELEKLSKRKDLPNWKDMRFVLIIPFVMEPYEVMKKTMEYLAKQTFPIRRISVCLASEAAIPAGYEIGRKLQKEYEGIFENIWVTRHVLSEDEIRGKSANMNYASRYVSKQAERLGWDDKLTLITDSDSDSKLPAQYYSYIAYEFVKNPDRLYKFYWAPIVFYANIWKLPFFLRMKATIDVTNSVSRTIRTDKLIPFSTYCFPLFLAKGIDFWNPNSSGEDWDTFHRALFKYKNKVSTVPIFLKVMSDAAEGDTLFAVTKNNYLQTRRWAWGISDDKFIIKSVFKALFKGELTPYVLYRSFDTLLDHVFGSTVGFVLLIGGNIPPLVNPILRNTVLGARLPVVSSFIIRLTLLTFAVTILINYLLQPLKEGKESLLKKLISPFQWLLNPFVAIFFMAIPGLDANTRLLFSRYLSYWVTRKK
ncbi:hypothetical protein JW796_02850 [Candidatus Dojkabacteria bacterium]|nr:hypothetical protein [Candidatus Dojkabacteria bacterium]